MSDNGEIFRYKKHGGKFLKMRKEFLEICEYDVINALILRVFENELEQKRAAYEATNAQRQVRGQQPQRPNFWIEMPWARLIHKLHMDGNMSENTIKAHMRSVLAKTFLIQRKNPKDPNRKPYQYMLNVDAIQNAIDHLGDEPFLDDASYLAPPEEVESQVSTSDPSTIDTSNFDPSTPSQELIPSHQDLTPGSRSVGYQSLTPLIDNIDSQNKEIIIDEYIVTESDTPTVSPPVVGDARALVTYADCIAYLQRHGITSQGNPGEQMRQAREVLFASSRPAMPPFYASLSYPQTLDEALIYLVPHGALEENTEVEIIQLARKLWIEAHEDEQEQRETWQALQAGLIESGVLPQSDTQSQQGDVHGYANNDLADLASDHVEYLPGMPASREDEQALVTEGDDYAVVATDTPDGGDAVGNASHHARQAVREAVHGEAVSKKGRDDGERLEQYTPTPTPAQAPPPQSEQAALGQALVTHCYLCGELVSREPVPGPLVCESCKRKAKQAPKWNVAAMVAEAERLREKPFSAIARPKETKKAQALFKRKPDLTQEEFEAAWRHWATPWWHENNGLFTLTDLAATPKNKSEMRLIIALEKLERGKPPLFTVPKQSTFVPRPSKIEVPDDFILSAYSYH